MADLGRITLPRERYWALVGFASKAGCICAAPEQRLHDGKCIGCWALEQHIESLRRLATLPPSLEGESHRVALAEYYAKRIASCEAEQRLRAEQLPAAEHRLAEARKEDEAARG